MHPDDIEGPGGMPDYDDEPTNGMEDTMDQWVIETWMGRRAFVGQSFESFEDARDFISAYADSVATSEEEYDGLCEDLYAVRISGSE